MYSTFPSAISVLNLIFEGKAKVEIVERRTHTTHSSSSGPYYNSSFSGPNHYHAGSSSSGPSTDYHGGMSSSNSHTDYYYYIAEEIYLDSVIPLLKETDISKGRTVFPFQYALPTSDLPCNIEASNGAVTYVITAHVKGPNFGNEVIEKLPFVITPFLDLNTVPLGEFMVTEFEEWKEAGGCCCSRGPDVVKVRLNVPRRFFIPGEFIPVTVITENKTGSLLGVATVQLILTLTCTAQGKSREMEQNLGEIAGPVVKAGCMQTWVVNNLVVPIIKPVGIPPSGLGGCNIIDASYELRVIINDGGWINTEA